MQTKDVDDQFTAVLEAGAMLRSADPDALAKGAKMLAALESSMLTPTLTRRIASLPSDAAAGPRDPVVDRLIGDLQEYYVSLYRIASSGIVFGDMTEKQAVDAINAHWTKSILALVLGAAAAVLFGGSIFGLVQYNGIKSSLDSAQAQVDQIRRDTKTARDDADKALDEVKDQTAKLTDETKVAKGLLDKAAGEAASSVSQQLKTDLQNDEAALGTQLSAGIADMQGHVKTLNQQLDGTANTEFHKMLDGKVTEAAKRISAIVTSMEGTQKQANEKLAGLQGWLNDAQRTREKISQTYAEALEDAQTGKAKLSSAGGAPPACVAAGPGTRKKPRC